MKCIDCKHSITPKQQDIGIYFICINTKQRKGFKMGRFCEKCGDYLVLNREIENHSCKEYVFEVEEYGEAKQYGTDIEDALEKFAKRYNDEGDLIDNEIEIEFENKKFSISAEVDISYRVNEI
jgi:DNA-directed RNA polymerase subunit M/transcription elongation factor TFIIS